MSVHPTTYQYLSALVATGLYGNSEPEAAKLLITTGIEARIETALISKIGVASEEVPPNS
jgi:hypothetical protein